MSRFRREIVMIRWLSGLLIVAVALFVAPVAAKAKTDEQKKDDTDKKAARDHGFLGVRVSPDSEGGAVIERIEEDSPASKAGLKTGDKITKIDDNEIKNANGLMTQMGKTKPDQTVKVTYKRDDKEMTVEVKLAKMPEQP
jgi:S1-C subfamily serine protease